MRVRDMVPAEGFLPAYIREAAAITDAPAVYHLACAATLLGAVVNDRTIVRMLDGEKVSSQRLALWSMCIGETTNFKTYSTEKATQLFRPMLSGRITSVGGSREGMEDLLLEIQNPVFLIPEAPTWFSGNRAGFARNGAAMWCELYDGWMRPQHFRRSKVLDSKGELPVSVHLLGAGATRAILERKCTRPEDWHGGLFVRVLWVNGQLARSEKSDGYDWSEAQLISLRAMIAEISGFSSKTPVIMLTKQARCIYNAWSDSLGRQRLGMNEAHNLVLKRLNVHVRRLAGIFAVSRLSPYVTSDDMDRACRFGDHSRDSVLSLNLRE